MSLVFSRNTNAIMVWVWMLQSPYSLGTQTELWFGHSHRILVSHERSFGLSMDVPIPVLS